MTLSANPTGDKTLRNRVFELLGEPRTAKRQYLDKEGAWRYSKLSTLTGVAFHKHLRGQSTVALCPVSTIGARKCATFLCWDIDEKFRDRLTIMRAVLTRRELAQGAWAVTGSDEGRGKVILSLATPIPQAEGIALAKGIHAECTGDLLWSLESTHPTSIFPQGGQGGAVRILGRNLARTGEGHLDEPLDLTGVVSDLQQVAPVALSPTYSPTILCAYDSGRIQGTVTYPAVARAEALRSSPYCGGGSTIFRDMGYLAKAAIICYGKDEAGHRAFIEWLNELESRIPADKAGTLRQLRDDSTRKRVWFENCNFMQSVPTNAGRDLLGDWKPLQSTFRGINGRRPGKGAWRVYDAAAGWIVSHRFNPHCFTIGYRQWANLSDYDDPAECRKAVDSAERAGMLFRLDRGSVGLGGLCTMLTVVGENESLQGAYDAGLATEGYASRLRERKQRNLLPPKGRVFSGRPWFPKSEPVDLPEAA